MRFQRTQKIVFIVILLSACVAMAQPTTMLETATSLEQQINASISTGDYKTARSLAIQLGSMLNSAYMNAAPSPQQKLSQLEAKYASASGVQRLYALTPLPRAAFNAGAIDKADQYSATLLDQAAHNSDNPSFYPDALFEGNTFRGRVAMKRGDIVTAKAALGASIASAASSASLTNLGPYLGLAQDLLSAGERDAVVAFLVACQGFWKTDKGDLNLWITSIRGGGTPAMAAALNNQ